MIDNTIEKKLDKMNKFDSKQSFVNFIFYSLVSFFVFSLLFFVIVIAYSYFLFIIRYYSFFIFTWFLAIPIVFICTFYFLEITPLIFIPLISYKRTNYTGFLYETLIELQFIFILYVILFIQMFVPVPIFSLISVGPLFIVIGYRFLSKPVIQGWTFSNSGEYTRSGTLDIVENQTLTVNDFQDGYSMRPIFDTLTDIFDGSYDKKEFTSIFSSFSRFIAINGDLISFDIHEHMVKLYIRTSIIQKTSLLNFFLQFKYLKNIIRKEDLTCISFDLDTMEISFKLNHIDYKKLDNVTFNKLGYQIINRFKAGIKEFLDQNYETVYEAINPKENAKSFMIYHKKIRSIY